MLWFRKAGGPVRERSVYSFGADDEEPGFAVRRWMAIFAVGVVILGIVAHVNYVRETTLEAARSQGLIAANLLSQNSARLFDMAEYLAVDLEGRVDGRSWDSIGSDVELHDAMVKAVSRFPYVNAISLFDAAGNTRFSTLGAPAPAIKVADREYFRAHMRAASGIEIGESVIGQPMVGRIGGVPIFIVSRALRAPDGTLRGVVGVSLRTDYFKHFLETFQLPYRPTLELVRQSDGIVLVSEPGETMTAAVPVPEPVRSAVTSGRLTQPLETDAAILTVQRLPQWPVYAVVSFDKTAVDAAWKAAVVDFVVIGAIAVAALIALAALVPGRHHPH